MRLSQLDSLQVYQVAATRLSYLDSFAVNLIPDQFFLKCFRQLAATRLSQLD